MKKRPQPPAAVREALARGEVKPSLIDRAKNTANDDLYVDPYEEFEEKEMPAEAAAKFREDLAHVPRLAALRKRATADPSLPREEEQQRRMSPAVRAQTYEERIARRPLTAPPDCFYLYASKAERDLLDSNATFGDVEIEFATLREEECMTVARFEGLFPNLRRKATSSGGSILYYWGDIDQELVVCLCLDEDRSSVLQYYYLPGV